MRKNLIFKQVKPLIHLEELPPAPIYKGHPDKTNGQFYYQCRMGK